jgi:U3 small nucleolar RNA-associated protein 21
MSPRGDFLATSHVGDLGIYLWTNVTLYSHVTLKPLPADHRAREIRMPLASRNTDANEEENQGEKKASSARGRIALTLGFHSSGEEVAMDVEEPEFASPEQIAHDLITLANLPSSRWQNLLNLDVIKARNKPKEAVRKPKDAPFFLPTVSGLETKFDLTAGKGATEGDGSRILISRPLDLSAFGQQLLSSETPEDFVATLAALKEKGPSAIEIELISLAPEGGGSVELMVQFLNMILQVLMQKRDFEAAQAYLALFMKHHADAITAHVELVEALEAIQEVQEKVWKELDSKLGASATLVGFYKNSVIC